MYLLHWNKLQMFRTAPTHLSRRSFDCDATKKRANQMAIAREVQRNLLPKHMPRLETLEYAGSCEPAWAVGGDYYDFLGKDDGRVGFVLADVSGKGVSAALLMASLQASVRSQYVVVPEDLADLFRAVNKLFYESVMAGFFATLFFAEYLDKTRELRYVNCGHCPAFLLRADGQFEKLHSTATVLGMFEKWDCSVGETSISCGDILIVYSDGVTESRSASGEFGRYDDLTLLLVGRGSDPFSRATLPCDDPFSRATP